jgi:hypothetical protein
LLNQKILIYGKVNHINPNKYTITPKYFIGSGLVEFEELIQHLKHQKNLRIFNILVILAIYTFIDFTRKSFFIKPTDKQNQ